MYYTQEQIDRANQADLVLFLQSQGEPLERAGQEYRWKRHDSLTVRGNKWYRHSQSKGGGPIDFVMEFFGKSFTEAVELLTGEKGAAPPPDRPCPASLSDFRLPPPNNDNRTARNYLTAARRIDEDVTGFFFASGVVVGCVLVNIAAGKEKARHIFINAAGGCEVVPRCSVVGAAGR